MEQEKSSVVTMKKNSRKGSISSMFMHTDGVDFLLMLFGFIGSVGDGLLTPLVLFITSHLMNNIGTGSSAVSLTDSFSNSINKVPSLSLSLSLSYTHVDTRMHTTEKKNLTGFGFCG